eukprot:COSAG01_NODE_1637_length_9660_cov_7.731932_4_plen_207_part_00
MDAIKKDEIANINVALTEAASAEGASPPAVVCAIVNKDSSMRFLQQPDGNVRLSPSPCVNVSAYCLCECCSHAVCMLQRQSARNPAPGVCVDICSETAPGGPGTEFYLNPAPCSTSTCKPVRYIIVQNKRADEPEDFAESPPVTIRDFQQFTYNMCWMFPNWPAPVKVPAVVQCAGKLAKLMEDVRSDGKGEVKVHSSLLTGFYYL